MRDADVVDDLLTLLQAECREVCPATLTRIEAQVRHRWGGERVYILRDPHREDRKAAALQDWRDGQPISAAANAHGIDRSTLYRLINRRRSPP